MIVQVMPERLGKYEVKERIGQGGMGAVYRARDTTLNRDVAIKLIAHDAEGTADAGLLRTRLEQEAKVIASVRHRHVVNVEALEFMADGTPYMVMEYLHGETLHKRLRRDDAPMPTQETAHIASAIAAAAASFHARGIIHRDLKPSNVFLAATDDRGVYEVKVLDFGLAKLRSAEDITRDGHPLGTPHFMSPEQARGRRDVAIGPATDQYALGAILYCCLTKRMPYHGRDNLHLLESIVKGDFPAPSSLRRDIPAGLERIILRAMALDPADRYPSVQELGWDLIDFNPPGMQETWRRTFAGPPRPVPHQMSTALRAGDLTDRDTVNDRTIDEIQAETKPYDRDSTVVAFPEKTQVDPDAQAARLARPPASASSAGPTVPSVGTPSAWKWEKEQSGATVAPPARRRRSRALLAAGAAAAVALVLVGTRLASRSRTAVPSEPAASVPASTPPRAALPLPPPALTPERPAAPVAPAAPAAAEVAAAPSPPAPVPAPAESRRRHRRAKRPEIQIGNNGALILPDVKEDRP